MTVFQHKPAPKKPRHLGLIALNVGLKYATRALVLLAIVLGGLLIGAILVSAVIAMFMAVALFWVPWPTDWFLQLVTGYGVLLYALGALHLIYKLYRHAARIERNQKEYI